MIKKLMLALAMLVLLTGCNAKQQLVVSGNLEAKEITISAETGGIVKEVSVAEGAQVKAGDVLAKIDPTLLQHQVDQAKAALAMADARAREVGAGSRNEQVRSAKANLEQMQALTAGAQNMIKTLESSITDTQKKIDDLKNSTGYSLNPGYQQQVASLEGSKTNLNIQLENARSQLAVYQAQARAAQAQYNLVAGGATSQAKEAALAQVDQAKAAVKLAEAQLAKAEVKAPVDGVVTVIALQAGELAGPGMTLAKLVVVKEMSLTVYVPEDQLSRVQVGQEVKFRVDAYPKEEFSGKVKKINTQAEFTPKNVQSASERVNMVFGVTIEVTGGQDRLKPGMPADVTL